jgi:hypothetical protein
VIGVLFSAEHNDLHGRERFCRIACWKSTEGIFLSRKKMFLVNHLQHICGGVSARTQQQATTKSDARSEGSLPAFTRSVSSSAFLPLSSVGHRQSLRCSALTRTGISQGSSTEQKRLLRFGERNLEFPSIADRERRRCPAGLSYLAYPEIDAAQTIAWTTPPSTRKAAPFVADDKGLHT